MTLLRFTALAALALLGACGGQPADLVVYIALDRAHSEPIVRAFEKETGLVVSAHYDIEANKSLGLRTRIQEESNNPLCDVFWNNEVVQTVLLSEAGLLAPYTSPVAADIDDQWKDPDGRWTGFGARARVLIVNTELMPDEASWPRSMADFLLPAHKGIAGMAKPLTGTTAAHAALLIERDGLDETLALFEALRDNEVRFGPGNAHLMRLVREGSLSFGWTDTDDAKVAIDEGFPVVQILPDQGADEPGLILIPNTISLVAGTTNEEPAKRFIDYVLSRDVEESLAHGLSAQIPVRTGVPRPDHVLDVGALNIQRVDWNAVGRAYTAAEEDLHRAFDAR